MLKNLYRMEKPEDEELQTRLEEAKNRLAAQQMLIKEHKLPVLVLFEGWGAAGKGSTIGKIIRSIDPRFFKVATMAAPTQEQLRRPFLYKYFEKIPEARQSAAHHGTRFGGTGGKVVPVTACKGTTGVYGNYDTQELARQIHEDYYLGWDQVKLPHKFKIAVGGCPNSCMKPSLNDFGVEGHKVPAFDTEKCRGCAVCQIEKNCPMKAAKLVDGKLHIDDSICKTCGVCTGKCPFKAVAHDTKTMYQIYVGGTWGKRTRMGTPLSRLVSEEEILPLLEKTMLWFKENAYAKERLGMAIDRIGEDKLEAALFDDDLLRRKEEILSRDILQRP